MKIKNNLIFIGLLVLILIGVGCVSATPEMGADNTLKISDSNENVMVDTGDACLGQPISLDENYTYNNDGILGDNSYIGTFTDLQEKINAADGVLDLEYNFTFNNDFDNHDDLKVGVNINKALTVNGNGYTISGNNTAAIMIIRGEGVILNNITFVDGYYSGKAGTIFSSGDLTINNCTFTNCLDAYGYAIYIHLGTLSLSNNTVEGIIYNRGGVIASETTAVVLDNSTYNVLDDTYDLTAGLVDDNGNVIQGL